MNTIEDPVCDGLTEGDKRVVTRFNNHLKTEMDILDTSEVTADPQYEFRDETTMESGSLLNDNELNDTSDETGTSKSIFAMTIEEIELSITEELSKLQNDLELQMESGDVPLSSEQMDSDQQAKIHSTYENQNGENNVDTPQLHQLTDPVQVKDVLAEVLTDRNIHTREPKKEISNAHSVNFGRCILETSSECDGKELLLLPCLHAVCKPCLDQHEPKTITCRCGQQMKHDKKKLPSDFVNRNETLIAKAKIQCGYLKEPCANMVISYCTNCKVSLCSDCQEDHGRIRMMSFHEIIPIDELDKCPPEKRLKGSTCQKHPQQRLLYVDRRCGQPICHLCLTGSHEGHDVKDMKSEYAERTRDLGNSLGRFEERLRDIQEKLKARYERLTELQLSHDQLGRQIVETHENVAAKFLHRLKDLLQKTNDEYTQLEEKVREDIQHITEKEASFLTTMTYANRCVESTTQAEFLELFDVMSRKITRDLSHPVPEDSTRGKYVVFSHVGLKALEQLVDVFGDVRLSDKPDALKDEVRTPSEIQEECKILHGDTKELNEQLKLKGEKLERMKMAKKDMKAKLEHAEQIINHLQSSLGNIGLDPEVTPYLLMTSAVKISNILQYVHLQFDHKRVNLHKTRINKDEHLVNSPETRPRMHSDKGFQHFCGTCSTIPILKAGGPQYFEVLVGIGIDNCLLQNILLLNIGLCREKDRDVAHYIPAHQYCYSLEVGMCNKHGGVCTRIWKDGKTFSHLPDTVQNSEQSETSLHYGIVCDDVRGKIAFFDVKNNEVLSVLKNVNFHHTLWPMFGLYKLNGLRVEMKIVNGKSIRMTAEKKSMILKGLHNDFEKIIVHSS